MKKLFIITDVSLSDARFYLKNLMSGTVVRAELVDSQSKIGSDFLYQRIRDSSSYYLSRYEAMGW